MATFRRPKLCREVPPNMVGGITYKKKIMIKVEIKQISAIKSVNHYLYPHVLAYTSYK